MTFNGYELSAEPLDDILSEVEMAFGVQLDRSGLAYGTQGATIGLPSSTGTWIRIAWCAPEQVHRQAWAGAEAASAISGVRKPELYRSYRWRDQKRSVVWRADEVTLITARAVDGTGVLSTDPQLPPTWWESLRSSLTTLGSFSTQRIGMAQDHLTRRINQVFSDERIDTTVTEWTTAHADVHWGNLTAPDCYLLDWEDWGNAPRGLDAATLWGHSLAVPLVANRVQEEFAHDLTTRSGQLAQLLFCANVIRINGPKLNPSPLLGPAKQATRQLVAALR